MEQHLETELPIVEGTSGYGADKTYALYVNPANRHISGLIGFLGPVSDILDNRNYESYSISDLTEEEYIMISRSLNSNEAMTFLGDDNRTIISRAIMIDLLDNTFFDEKSGAIYGLDNVVKLRVRCIDNTDSKADDVDVIEVKNIKKLDNPVSINGAPVEQVKTSCANPAELTFKLEGTGMHTIRFKAKIPTVDYLWLTVYPQMLRLTDEDQANLRAWIEANPKG